MNVLLVGGEGNSQRDRESIEKFKVLLDASLPDGDHNIQLAYLDQLIFNIDNGQFNLSDAANPQTDLKPDCVFIRGPKMHVMSGYAYYLSQFCNWNKIPVFNDYSAYYPGGKFAQHTIFLKQGAKLLNTFYSLDKAAMLRAAEGKYGYPYIIKSNFGSHGDSNYLVESSQQAEKIIADESNTVFLVQQYCPNDHDYRVLFVGSEQLIFERRGQGDSHINNTSKGGVAVRDESALPADVISKAREVTESMGLTIAGIDVMPHLETGELYFLEVNSQPQMSTGALLSEKKESLQHLLGTINDQG